MADRHVGSSTFQSPAKDIHSRSSLMQRTAFRSGRIQIYPARQQTTSLAERRKKGLDIYTEHENGLSVCPLLPKACPIKHKAINVIYEAYNGIFWIGTRSGLFRFDEARKEYKQYTVADGLPNNVIHGILEDEYGKLWLSTNKGLSCFHPETEKFRNYTNNDGLQSNQFTNNAYYRTEKDKCTSAASTALPHSIPEQIVDNPYTPPVHHKNCICSIRRFSPTTAPEYYRTASAIRRASHYRASNPCFRLILSCQTIYRAIRTHLPIC